MWYIFCVSSYLLQVCSCPRIFPIRRSSRFFGPTELWTGISHIGRIFIAANGHKKVKESLKTFSRSQLFSLHRTNEYALFWFLYSWPFLCWVRIRIFTRFVVVSLLSLLSWKSWHRLTLLLCSRWSVLKAWAYGSNYRSPINTPTPIPLAGSHFSLYCYQWLRRTNPSRKPPQFMNHPTNLQGPRPNLPQVCV